MTLRNIYEYEYDELLSLSPIYGCRADQRYFYKSFHRSASDIFVVLQFNLVFFFFFFTLAFSSFSSYYYYLNARTHRQCNFSSMSSCNRTTGLDGLKLAYSNATNTNWDNKSGNHLVDHNRNYIKWITHSLTIPHPPTNGKVLIIFQKIN